MASSGPQKWCGLLTALCSVIAGFVVLIHFSTVPVIEYGKTLSWQSTIANISTAQQEGRECLVTYKYTVDTTSYTGSRTRTQGEDSYRSARHLCTRLYNLQVTDVWYDPKLPSHSSLRLTYTGDFWLAVNLLDSLALVVLGGAIALWASGRFEPLLLACCTHAALGFITAVPVSIIRAARAVPAAVLPLVSGLGCGIVALVCAYQMGCGSRNAGSRALRSKSLDGFWFAQGDVVP